MNRYHENRQYINIPPAFAHAIEEAVARPLPDAYRVEPAKSGAKTLSVTGRALHSRYNPLREAEALFRGLTRSKKNCFLFFGLGLAHHVLHFAEQKANYIGERDYANVTLFIFESDPVIAAYTLSHVDLSPLSCFSLHLLPFDEDALIAYATEHVDAKRILGVESVVLGGLRQQEKERAQRLTARFLAHIESEYSNLLTRFHFAGQWAKNTLYNLPFLGESADVGVFAGAFKREACATPAVICGAGPTLAASLPAIARAREDIALIAVDTALGPLIKAGITPDFVVTLDAGFFNYLDFVFEPGAYPYLAADFITYPGILRHAKGRRITFSRADEGEHSLLSSIAGVLGTHVSALATSGTVASTAIDFAVTLGFSPLLLLGHDLAFPRYETHVRHALSYEEVMNGSNRIATPETQFYHRVLARRAEAEGGHVSDFILLRQKAYYESLPLRYPRTRFARSTHEGLPFAGVEEAVVADVAAAGTRAFTLREAEARYTVRAVSKKATRDALTVMLGDTEEAITRINEGYEALLANRHDADAVARVLDAHTSAVSSYVARLPFLAGMDEYLSFVISRREAEGDAKAGYIFFTELQKTATYFHTRVANAIRLCDNA